MKVTIVHLGGSRKLVEFEGFDAPRPWIRLRYPNGGGGLFSFGLAHGNIECKRSEHPQWRIATKDLATLREMATLEKVKFTVVRWAKHHAVKPRAPKKKTAQKQIGLFNE